MSAKKVVAFRLTEVAAKRLLAQISVDSANVIFTGHAVKQMKKRRITRIQVLNCLKKGSITEAPCLDHRGMWKATIERRTCGESIGCAVAINASEHNCVVITAFWVNP